MIHTIKITYCSPWKAFGYVAFLFAVSFLGSCKKFVQIPPPVTTLVTASVFNNDFAATSAQLSIYVQMVNNQESWNLSQNTGLLSDELMNYTTTPIQVQLYTNSMLPTANSFLGPWLTAYSYIYQANAIINNLQGSSGVSAVATRQLTGESEFIRAFWFFYLVNCYGDVPLVTTTDYTVNATIARTPKSQLYQQIISDLLSAQNLLNTNYVDATDTAISTERVRPTKGVAAALLSRVYLYVNKYDSAEIQATAVINNPLYKIVSPLTASNYVFNKNNNVEAIWQLSTPLPGGNNGATTDGQNYILVSTPNSVAMSQQLFNSFETGDIRKTVWIGSYKTPAPITTYYFPYKYKTNSLGTNGYTTSPTAPVEYIMVMRLAEQYLIRAEARALKASPDIAGAIADLNVIRNRAGLGNYAGATDKASLLTAILHERQVELFSEWGNRWFDLNRTGAVDTVLGSPGNVCQFKGGIWNSNGNYTRSRLVKYLMT